MKNKLLSICIPTYNRAETLDLTLNKLFSNPEFDEDLIEVIISDNCSTDNTFEVVNKYPLAHYYCNKENVRDCNFSIVLGYATGSYIRLFNDTLSFKKGGLRTMLEKIKKHKQDDCNLFFYENIFLNQNISKEISSKEDFLKTVSFYTTWIANFGVWRDEFAKLKDKDRYAQLMFVQVDWSYRIVENNKNSIIYFEDLFDVVTPNKKGGYNKFDIFVNKYLFLIKQEKISLLTYEKEKYRLFRYFIFPWLKKLFIEEKEKYSFDTSNVTKIILKKYWYEPYLYPMSLSFCLKKIKERSNR
ncbi:glycosyltransferase family 2 protein [Flavobacterium sp. P21]|uniref:glycosyltransferase family 2 protein n=1 Tax=Flavobacterium sp. P21 TaxID=3423948 RepID=UPI003D677EA0